MTSVEIAGVRSCDCPTHAIVALREVGGKRRFRLRVHSDAGQAVLAESSGLASTRAGAIDMLRDALAAAGGELAGVIVAHNEDTLSAQLIVRDTSGEHLVHAEPCEAIVAACRLRLPVFLDESPAAAVPDAYRRALSDLDVSGLGA
jgi:bifunctional DNase/RNase